MKRAWMPLFFVIALAGPGLAQQPRVINGKVEAAAVSGNLQTTVRQVAGTGAGPVWIGYAAPIAATKPHLMCCFDSGDFRAAGCCSGCRLEGSNGGYFNSDGGTCVANEPPTEMYVYLRYANGQPTRIRPMTPDCGVDAGGLTIHWLTGVKPAESVALLAGFVNDSNNAEFGKLQDAAIMAIAMHQEASVDAVLGRFLAPGQPEKIREKTAFWIASERGRPGLLALQKLAREDKDDRFRRQLTFDLSISKEPEAIPELIRMAHQDADGGVRGQALFWLAQKAGKKVVGEIADAIENDPDTEVKKKAVFALTQMPGDEGVTRLIQVARTNRNREVRKQAIFWLGQSRDPRALAFIEEILTR